MKGISPTANAISAHAIQTASVAPVPCPNRSPAIGPDSARNATVAGTMATMASRTVLVNSPATPPKSPPAASRDALGSMAVARETVMRECGRIHSRCALA